MQTQSGTLRRLINGSLSVTGFYFLAYIALGLVGASLGPTLPELASQTGTQLDQISLLFTARSLGYLLGAFGGGRLYDRLPAHPLMAVALVFMAAGMTVVPLVPLLGVLAFTLLLIGLGQGMLDVGGNTLLVWIHGKRVGPLMNGLHFFFGVGAFLAPIVVAQMVVITGGTAAAYWLIALLIILLALWLLRLPGPRPPAHTSRAAPPSLDHRLVWLIVLFFVLYVGAEVGFGGWIFSYALESGVMRESIAAYITSAFWAAFAFSRLLSIPAAVRLRPATILFLNLFGALGSLAFFLIWPESRLALWVGALGFGMSIAAIFPTMLSLAAKWVPLTGRITGYFFLGANLGGMSLPWLIGQFFEGVGPQSMIWILLIDLLLAALLLGAMLEIKSKQQR